MKTKPLWVLVVTGAGVLSAPGQAILSSGHMDIGILYEAGAWDLHVHKESPPPDEEFAPSDAIVQLGARAQLPGGVPNSPAAAAFFGPVGSALWILPKSADPELPFLGIGAEEMSSADWNGPLTLTLTDVRGPGNVLVWDVGAFGELQPLISSRDGISAVDSVAVEAGGHAHYFWAFTEPGDYEVHLSAKGNHAVDGPVQSEPAAYRFQVVPEPGAETLVCAGLTWLVWSRYRSRGGCREKPFGSSSSRTGRGA